MSFLLFAVRMTTVARSGRCAILSTNAPLAWHHKRAAVYDVSKRTPHQLTLPNRLFPLLEASNSIAPSRSKYVSHRAVPCIEPHTRPCMSRDPSHSSSEASREQSVTHLPCRTVV
jgi:hypothetical protein